MPIIIHKSNSGQRYMAIVTSNAYEDREGETITTDALRAWVEDRWKDGQFKPQPLLFWHDGPPIGDVVWADMEGPFLIEMAVESPTAYAKAVWDYIEQDDEPWGASHGFRFLPEDFEDGTYRRIYKFETSALPLRFAANPITFSGVL